MEQIYFLLILVRKYELAHLAGDDRMSFGDYKIGYRERRNLGLGEVSDSPKVIMSSVKGQGCSRLTPACLDGVRVGRYRAVPSKRNTRIVSQRIGGTGKATHCLVRAISEEVWSEDRRR